MQQQLRRSVPVLVVSVLALGCLVQDTQAQAPSAAQEGRWPAWLDAMAAAPQSHRVLFENERVRVLEVVVRPGETEPVHAHSWPSLMFILEPATLRYIPAIVLGKQVQLGSTEVVRQGPKPSGIPAPRWLPPEGPHAVENIDTRDYRALRIELKPAS